MSSMSTDLGKTRTEKRCRSCFRDDIHIPVQYPAVIQGFLTVVTFGVFLLFKPSRCVCCGTKRYF